MTTALPAVKPPARFGWAALAGLIAGGSAASIPFWPAPFAVLFAALAVALALWRPRLGLAAALAVVVFPLGNIALGLAILYGVAAPVWFALAAWAPAPVRRAVLAGSTVVALHGLAPIDVAREESPVVAARAVAAAVPPDAWTIALALAAAAATVAFVRTPWRASLWGSAVLAALLLPNPELAALPVVGAVWGASTVLALRGAT